MAKAGKIQHWKHGWIPINPPILAMSTTPRRPGVKIVSLSTAQMANYDVGDWDSTSVRDLTVQNVTADDDVPGKYARLRASVKRSGKITEPVDVLDALPGEPRALVDGKHRVLAARELGLMVPVRLHPAVVDAQGDPSWPTWDERYRQQQMGRH